MTTKKRDRLEVIYDILSIIRDHKNSMRSTPLLRYANLSSKTFSEYFSELLNKDLVRETMDKKGIKYLSLSDKGFLYLEKYKLIIGFINEFEL